jgi:uncharacterized protein YlxW (UPF0749 family)
MTDSPVEPAPAESTSAESTSAESKAAQAKSADPLPASEASRAFAPDFLLEMFANPLDAGYGDAAERRTRLGPESRASRRFGVGLRTVALILTGLLLTIAYQQTVAAKPATNKAQKGLVTDVRQRQQTTDTLERQANALRLQVTKLRNAALGSSDAQMLTDLEAETGLGAVTGDGVIVSISDGPQPVNPVTNQPEGAYYGRVQDNDLQFLSNELWREGAEAISINGQRLTSTSAIRTAGDAILVDFVPLQEPYEISAIGPNLADKLRDSRTGQQYEGFVSSYGMHFSIDSHDNLSLPAAPDPQLKYATTGTPPSTPPSSTPPSTPATQSPSPGGH